MNADMIKLLKWISERYKQTLRPAPERLDGVPKGALMGQFKLYLERALCFAERALCFALLRANALALHNQGRPDIRRP